MIKTFWLICILLVFSASQAHGSPYIHKEDTVTILAEKSFNLADEITLQTSEGNLIYYRPSYEHNPGSVQIVWSNTQIKIVDPRLQDNEIYKAGTLVQGHVTTILAPNGKLSSGAYYQMLRPSYLALADTFTIYPRECPTLVDHSCVYQGATDIYLKNDHTFTLFHEIGHLYQFQQVGSALTDLEHIIGPQIIASKELWAELYAMCAIYGPHPDDYIQDEQVIIPGYYLKALPFKDYRQACGYMKKLPAV